MTLSIMKISMIPILMMPIPIMIILVTMMKSAVQEGWELIAGIKDATRGRRLADFFEEADDDEEDKYTCIHT